MRHTFVTMGTAASLWYGSGTPDAPGFVHDIFSGYDQRFSLYNPASELSRVAAGEVALTDSSQRLLDSYGEALAWRDRTGGAFSPHRPDGVIDLNGIVKAQAMRDSGHYLRTTDMASWCLNVGGDVLVDGTDHGVPWSVGISDPHDRTRLLLALQLSGDKRAVATSGIAERGDHIWKGGTSAAPDFSQVSVVADDIVTADVLATAIMAGGQTTLDEVTSAWQVDVVTVSPTGELLVTPGLRAALIGQRAE